MVMSASDNIQGLVTEFVRSVIGQNEAIERRDTRAGNRLALKYCGAAEQLLQIQPEGLGAFARLLNDSRIDVRTMAAAFLIPYETAQSKAVLELSAQGEGIVALGAKMALERWEKEGKGIDFT